MLAPVRQCERCLTDNPAQARFCMACGAALATGRDGGDERKLVTVLFADLVGSTADAHGVDPEDVRDRLRRFFIPVRDQIRRHGGTTEKFIGDAVVAVFGAPRAHGDDAHRAVRCALAIVDAVADLNAADPNLHLAVRVGISTGEAVVALDSGHERGEAIATGDAMNIAARLQAGALPGTVLVSSDTRLATRRLIRYQPHPAVQAKGKPEPLEAWRAIGTTSPLDSMPTGAPFTGRDREIGLLTAAVRRTAALRRPSLLTVLGPAGIGKSRLVHEFTMRVRDEAHVMTGRCLPYRERIGYAATSGQVKALASILETDAPSESRSKLEAAVSAYLPSDELPDVVRYISLLLGLGVDDPVPAREPIFYSVRRLIEGVARERTALLVFEDLHWSDESQYELLEYLVRQVSDVPALFLVVARPELADLRESLIAAPLAETVLRLDSLSTSAAVRVANSLLPEQKAKGEVERLVELSGGNPLFLEELVATMPQTGRETDDVPTTVREAIAWRVDALPPEERSTLLDASVIGRTFWHGILAAMDHERAGQLGHLLESLTLRGLVRGVTTSHVLGEHEFVFKHALVREVAYRTLTRAARRERHASVARYIEQALGDNARDLATTLAHHWRQAGEWPRGVEYVLIAARRAVDGWAPAEAQSLFEQALEMAAGDQLLSLRIRRERALSHADLSDFVAAAAELDELLPAIEGREAAEALSVRARVAYWLEDADGCLQFAERAHQLSEALSDQELRGPAISAQGLARELVGDLREAASFYEKSRAVWVTGARQQELATLNENWANVAYWRGEYQSAEHLARSSYELGDVTHRTEPILRSGGWRGLAMAAHGRTEEAIEWLDRIFARAQQLDPRWGAATLNYQSLAFRDMQMFDEARRRNLRALEIVGERGSWGMPEMQAEIDLMFTDLAIGDPGRVQQSFPKLWDAAINGAAWRPWLGGGRLALVRAELALQTEGAEDAAIHATRALEMARKVGRPKYEAASRAILGEALVRFGDTNRGLSELRQAAADADRLGSPAESWRIRAMLGKQLYATGDDAASAAAYERASASIVRYAKSLRPDHAAVFLAAAPVSEVLKTSHKTDVPSA
jgi:class 3 adenylate cyclase/tetratricopeptide (TPR) repeat protein